MEKMSSFVLLVPLLPLVGILPALTSEPSRQRRWAAVASGAFAASFAGATAALVLAAMRGAWTVRLYEPGTLTAWLLPLGMQVDRLSGVMMALIAGIGALVFRYSRSYMHSDPGYGRFLALIGVTTSALLFMVASPNLLMLFACWQLVSYLLALLAHDLHHSPTLRSAISTFWFLRAGDVALLLGVALAHSLYGTLELDALFGRAAHDPGVVTIWPGAEVRGPTAVTALLFIGALSRSAQFPLHVWLLRSLYAPTPVSALLHAGIVNAAGFLINRFAPLYGQSPATLHAIFVIGTLTALFGASTMLVQSSVKKTLTFSTIGQMGYMLMECGLGAFSLALFHLIAHGLFKATLFLSSGDAIRKARLHPAAPPGGVAEEERAMSRMTLLTGVSATLLLPVVLLMVAHGALTRVPLLTSQGDGILLFFVWITASQAILTLSRLRTVASWKVAGTMLATVLVVLATYLVAAQQFGEFLYPDPSTRESFFEAAALPAPIFNALVILFAGAIASGWIVAYARASGRQLRLAAWTRSLGPRLYVLLLNEWYVDQLFSRLGQRVSRLFHAGPRAAGTGGPVASGASSRSIAVVVALSGLTALGVVPFGVFTGLIGLALVSLQGVALWNVLAAILWGLLSLGLFTRVLGVGRERRDYRPWM